MSSGQILTCEGDLTADYLRYVRQSAVVAIDTETTGLNPNRDLLCLVQLCDAAGNVEIVRTGTWTDAHRLRELLEDPTVTKVFHFALFDCAFLLRHARVEVANPFCTKIASKLARTYSPEHGLSALVKDMMGVDLDKTQQTTDWLGNLSAKQLEYAANDVVWLINLKLKLEEKLQRKGLLPSGMSYLELNNRCQAFIPTLVHLWLNGWEFGQDNRASVFSH